MQPERMEGGGGGLPKGQRRLEHNDQFCAFPFPIPILLHCAALGLHVPLGAGVETGISLSSVDTSPTSTICLDALSASLDTIAATYSTTPSMRLAS